ncbi:DNA recombination protein RmuC [Jatrophihabitans sp.]|uniref:DNA recombination protein RmuC n=1 Tax=Jatrophihabitans sp. TaxID=1932789 RepID=UPI0030C68E2D|nr:recombination protein RmuC [Jatrophihabitans sp.]
MDALIGLVALAAGLLLGWLLASRRTEVTLRTALAESAGLRATLLAEQTAARSREQLLLQSDGQRRDVLGAEAAEALEQVQRQLVELQQGRAGSDAALREQVSSMTATSERLRSETEQLVTALRAPQVRGRWGELQLERVVEAAGMTEHVDYLTQVTSSGDGPPQRPDMVVSLTGGRRVVVDSKVAFAAYLEAMQAGDDITRAARLKAHAKHLRGHIDDLAGKAYWQRFTPTPEFVVCFVPADAFLDAALREDPTLLEHAFSHDIVLATPSTLVALLRTIAYGWRQESLAENAAQVHALGRELYQRLTTLGGHVDRLGRSLGGAVAAYNDAVGSLERRVFTTARQMEELGVVAPTAARLAPLDPLLEAIPRPITTPELGNSGVIGLHHKGVAG